MGTALPDHAAAGEVGGGGSGVLGFGRWEPAGWALKSLASG